MKKHFLLLLCSAAQLYGEEPAATKLLEVRPAARCIEVRQFQSKSGFILWSPTLTLAEVIDAAGGLKSHNDRIEIIRLATNPAPDLVFRKNQLIQDRKVQKQTFDPGDRVNITYLLKPL